MKITSLGTKLDKSGNTYKVVEADGKKGNVFPKDPLYSLCELGADIDARWEKGEAFTMKDGTQGRYNVLARNDDGLTYPAQDPIAQNMTRKEEGIREAQASRNDAVKIASVCRDATLLTVSEMGHAETTDPKELDAIYCKTWAKWKKFLWSRYGEPHESDAMSF